MRYLGAGVVLIESTKNYALRMAGFVAFVLLVAAIFGVRQKFGSSPNLVSDLVISLVIAVVLTLVANR